MCMFQDELEMELADLEAETLDESLLEPITPSVAATNQVPAQPTQVPAMPSVPSHQPTPGMAVVL